MDNLTHSLIGLAAAKAGLERLSPAATALCVIAANAPDLDIVSLVGGRWAYLHHHRGITHSIVGTAALALLIPSLFWLGDFLISRLRGRDMRVKFRGLVLASLIASATHPLMDWANNYGVRPFLPWSDEWFYGDIVFILDPWLWLSLGGACFLVTAQTKWRIGAWALLATVLTAAIVLVPLTRRDSVFPVFSGVLWVAGLVIFILGHRGRFAERWGRAIPLVALALILVYWAGLSILHNHALGEGQVIAGDLASARGETLTRVAAMPTLANPLRWQCVAETSRATYRFDVSLVGEGPAGQTVRYEKPEGEAAWAYSRASFSEPARIFLGFARFPVVRVEGNCVTKVLVQMADLRYTEPGGQRGTFSLEVPVECSTESGVIGGK